MTEALIIAPGETGVLRLFALDMPPERARLLREPGAAAQALGVATLDGEQVDVFAVADMDEYGLAGYLAEGCGIAADRIDQDRDRLAAQSGWVMAVRSRAFGGRAAVLAPGAEIALIGVYREPATEWSAEALTAASARPGTSPARSPRAVRAQARRIGAAVFALAMLVVAGIVYVVVN